MHPDLANENRNNTQVRGAIQAAIAHFGRLDVIINNAGRGITRDPSKLTDEDIDDMMAVNVKSAMYGMQVCPFPHHLQKQTAC